VGGELHFRILADDDGRHGRAQLESQFLEPEPGLTGDDIRDFAYCAYYFRIHARGVFS
jgi:hypothetical protein